MNNNIVNNTNSLNDVNITSSLILKEDKKKQISNFYCYENQMNNELDMSTDIYKSINDSSLDSIERNIKEDVYNSNFTFKDIFKKGSLTISMLSYSIISIGVGCFSIPERFSQISLVLCIIELIIIGIVCCWTLNLLFNAALKQKLTTYSKTVEFYCGIKWRKFFDICNILYVYLLIVSYFVICKL